MHTYFSADSDHCLPFRYSLHWRALRWDVTWCCAPCWWFYVSNLHVVAPMSWWWIEPMLWSWCWWSCPVFLCPCVCGHLQKCYCHLSLALTSHIDCFRNVQLSPFPKTVLCLYAEQMQSKNSCKCGTDNYLMSTDCIFSRLTKIHPCLSTVAMHRDCLSEIMSMSSSIVLTRISFTLFFSSTLFLWLSV